MSCYWLSLNKNLLLNITLSALNIHIGMVYFTNLHLLIITQIAVSISQTTSPFDPLNTILDWWQSFWVSLNTNGSYELLLLWGREKKNQYVWLNGFITQIIISSKCGMISCLYQELKNRHCYATNEIFLRTCVQ